MLPDFDHLSEARAAITSFFTNERFEAWIRGAERCGWKHDANRLLDDVQKITLNPQYQTLVQKQKESGDYLISDASEVTIPGVDYSVSREIAQDAVIYAQSMAYSRVVNHWLKEEELEAIYEHHYVERIIFQGEPLKMSPQESVAVLKYYIERVAASTFPD